MSAKLELAPLLGAAGGAAAIVAASDHFQLDRKAVALGGVGLGIAVASATTGVVRQLATGVAAAGACIAVLDFIRELPRAPKRDSAPAEQPKPEPTAAAPSTERLTPEELLHLQKIAASLTPDERERLVEVEKRGEPELVRRLKATLVGLSIEDAVVFLRKNVLAAPHGRDAS